MGYVISDGERYISYLRAGAAPEKRGKVIRTDDRAGAWVFRTKADAEKEKKRLTKAARNMTVRKAGNAGSAWKGAAAGTTGEDGKTEDTSGTSGPIVKRRQFTLEERISVYLKDEGRCYLCGGYVEFSAFEVEHMIPLACGGTNDMSNLHCACHLCNSMKGAFPARDVIAQAEKIARHHAAEMATLGAEA